MAAPSVSENRHRPKKHQSESIPLPLHSSQRLRSLVRVGRDQPTQDLTPNQLTKHCYARTRAFNKDSRPFLIHFCISSLLLYCFRYCDQTVTSDRFSTIIPKTTTHAKKPAIARSDTSLITVRLANNQDSHA